MDTGGKYSVQCYETNLIESTENFHEAFFEAYARNITKAFSY